MITENVALRKGFQKCILGVLKTLKPRQSPGLNVLVIGLCCVEHEGRDGVCKGGGADAVPSREWKASNPGEEQTA